MKTITFLAVFFLAANAFNLTAYHLGVDAPLGFNETQVQKGLTCLNALSADAEKIYQTIKSANFDDIALSLGGEVEQFKTDLQTTCLPYFMDLADYVYEHTGDKNLEQLIEENFDKYYAYIIQDIAIMDFLIEQGNSDTDQRAGVLQTIIGQMLLGIIDGPTIDDPQVNVSAIVPFNHSKFFTEYFETIFQSLGINAPINVEGLIQCDYNIYNLTAIFLYMRQNFSSFDFQQKLDAIQYLISHIFATINNCEGAWETEGAILMPVFEAFEKDPINFTLDVANRIASNLPLYISSIKQQIVDIQEGNYVAAAHEKLNRIEIDFYNLVNFTSSTQEGLDS